jgi:proline iminopeptidase
LGAQEGSIQRDGFSLYYYAEGSGTPIIFLGGGPGIEVDYMKPAAELFPPQYQRVFLEQRGSGRSRPVKLTAENMSLRLMVEDLEALRRHLKLDRVMLAGHSWGGMLAMAYASSHPENVDRLVLIESGGPTQEFRQRFSDNIQARLHSEDKEAQRYWIDAAKHGVESDTAAREALRAITPGYFFDRAKGLAFAAAQPRGGLHQDALLLLNADLAKSYDLRDGLRQLLRPVLIIEGHQDPIGEQNGRGHSRVDSFFDTSLPDRCGHFPWIEQPDKMRAVVAEFLTSN